MEHVPGLQASPETSYEARIIYDTVVLKRERVKKAPRSFPLQPRAWPWRLRVVTRERRCARGQERGDGDGDRRD